VIPLAAGSCVAVADGLALAVGLALGVGFGCCLLATTQTFLFPFLRQTSDWPSSLARCPIFLQRLPGSASELFAIGANKILKTIDKVRIISLRIALFYISSNTNSASK
jgi:ABC-type nitrate/sulfonate/bicarbonate transport system permease component